MPAAALLAETALTSNAWPFEEAKKLIARMKRLPEGKTIIFSTGYGPSGLPHIGTFGEVARTTMVRHAFRVLTEDKVPTRLISFSDDMDGLRKVPTNIPNQDMVAQHVGKPLTRIPDPFGKFESFGHHNNAMLRSFLDRFGFDYEFMSATDCYTSGAFDEALLGVLANYDKVMAIMLPSLREERAETYSPFLPICPRTGEVLQVPVLERNVSAGTIVYADPATGEKVETPVTGGRCKLQWKPDWAMRWKALGVDYEMAGKDLIDSVKLSSKINAAIGGIAPEGFNYELFLDEEGKKISKSKGNGLTIEEWLRYASPESLSLFMYREPKAAKRLHFDVIPRNVDEYQQFLEGYGKQELKPQLGNPVWHIHAGKPPQPERVIGEDGQPAQVSFTMLLNLASASNTDTKEVLWGFLKQYAKSASPETHPRLDAMAGYAVAYYQDFVAPRKVFRDASEDERAALADLRDALAGMDEAATPTDIQTAIYDIGRRDPYRTVQKDGSFGVSLEWFNMLYQVLLGQEKGPRFGSFVAIYGIKNTIGLIDGALARTAG